MAISINIKYFNSFVLKKIVKNVPTEQDGSCLVYHGNLELLELMVLQGIIQIFHGDMHMVQILVLLQ